MIAGILAVAILVLLLAIPFSIVGGFIMIIVAFMDVLKDRRDKNQ